MSEHPLSDFAPEQLRALLAVAQDADAPGPTEEPGPTDRPSPSEPAGHWLGRWINQYKLVDILGEGGMAVVYLAEQEYPVARRVAMKLIKPGMDSKRVIARFEMERRTLALLNHPNIARIFDAGTAENGQPYFVMELVEGPPITEHCDGGKFSIEYRLSLFRKVCEAIHYAHQKGIIHRDIKASNVLIATEGGEAIPKVIDFGVARGLTPELGHSTVTTESGQLLGTPEYMSPEQVNLAGEDIDVRSDVYSLGVLLYLLLTGAMPFDSEIRRKDGIDAFRRVIIDEEPRTPSAHLAALGHQSIAIAENRRTEPGALTKRLRQELEWIPLKAMAKSREQRYQSAAELAEDISHYLDGVALIAGPPRRSYRIQKFVRRHKTLLAAIALLTITIAIGVTVSLAMYVRARVQAGREKAVSDLLNNTVLAALDPTRTQGGEITALSVLDAVSDALEGQFTDAPLIEAEIRHRLGQSYRSNNADDRWQRHVRRALEIRRRELGDNDPATITSMFELGSGLSNEGYSAEAQPLLVQVVAGRTRLYGQEDAKTLYAKILLARDYMNCGQLDVARRLFEEVRETARRIGGDEHLESILAMFFLGLVDGRHGHYEQAERWLAKALALSRRVRGEDHAWTGDFMGWLGWVYLLQGRYPDAEATLTEAIARETQIFGPDHWQTVQDIHTLVQVYAAWGKLEEAAKWRATLIGNPSDTVRLLGSMRYDEKMDTYTLRGCGMDIWDVFDEFHFAGKTLEGDGSITARIDSLENTDPWAKTGVMIRRALEPTSEHASIFLTPTGLVAFQYRSTRQGITATRQGGVKSRGFPQWVRLTRQGNTFRAEHSRDGKDWEVVQSPDPNGPGPVEIAIGQTVYIGLAVTSHNAGRAATAHIAHVTCTGNVSPDGPFLWSEDIGLQRGTLPKK
jgi:non-specific serine/threonine protein kinase/serine/threonine-protein kinase